MTRLELPGGGWAEIVDPLQVTHKKRRPVQRAMFDLIQYRQLKRIAGAAYTGLEPEELDLLEKLNDLLVVALVREWSFEFPIDLDGLGDLSSEVYDALQVAAAPLAKELLPNFEAGPDPKAPPSSSSSSGSPTGSDGDAPTLPTTTPEPTS